MGESQTVAKTASNIRSRNALTLALEKLRADRVAKLFGITILLLFALAALAPLLALWTGHDADAQFRQEGLTAAGLPVAPNSDFLMGTDNLGRDIFVRLAYGARSSLLVGVLSTALAMLLGTAAGVLSGYFGGFVDAVLSRAFDVILSFPYLLAAIALVSITGPSLPGTVGVIAFFSFAAIARIIRGQTISLRETEFMEASKAAGSSHLRSIRVDLLPNLTGPVLVYATLMIPVAVVFEASLSFLGLGVPPPSPTWGGMLADSVRYYQFAWWYVTFPASALVLTTFAFNMLGDSLRDALAPNLRGQEVGG